MLLNQPRRACCAELLLLVAAGPAVAAEETRLPLTAAPNARVGRVEGTRAFIALASTGSGCGSTSATAPSSASDGRTVVQGPLGRAQRAEAVGGGYELRSIARSVRAVASIGRLGTHAFSASPARIPAGLFERSEDVQAAWIALDARRIRGTIVPTRPRKGRPVLRGQSAGGTQQWVTVCS